MTRRKLSLDEQELWKRLRQTVRPLGRSARRKRQADPDVSSGPDATPKLPGEAATTVAAGLASPSRSTPQPAPAGPPPLVPLDQRERRRLSRGITEVSARFDLHGMSQNRAHAALLAFLRGAQARGYKTVLIITGKGRSSHAERGVLRGAVPEWLARPDLRDLVLGVEEAARRHGGPGALYVRLRRRG